MTVLEAIQRGTEFLAGKGVESPRLNAEWLVAHTLGLPRLQLYLQFDRELKPDETTRARALIQRRGKREPLQHLLGTAVFCGLEFRVSSAALVPRPETELLAETALEQLRAGPKGSPSVLDFGTGTGCLAITLAVRHPAAALHALDISPEALALARDNANRHGVTDRIHFHEGDGFSALPSGPGFDWIVANPPYIPTAEIAALEPEVRDYDPRAALDGGSDGLEFYRRLAVAGPAWVPPGGGLLLELGDGQAEAVRALLDGYNWVVAEVIEDYSGRPRVLRAQRGGA